MQPIVRSLFLAAMMLAALARPASAARNLEVRVGTAGGALVGADVCLGLANESVDGIGRATTDVMGVVRFPNLPAGSRTYRLSVTAPGLTGREVTFGIVNNVGGDLDPPQVQTVELPGNGATCGPAGPAPTPTPPQGPSPTPGGTGNTGTPTRTVTLDVRTVDYEGVAMPDAAVCAGTGPGPDSALFGKVTTDLNGNGQITGIPAGGSGIGQVVLSASRDCAPGQEPRTVVDGVKVWPCGVGANWVDPRGTLSGPVIIVVGAADQASADATAGAAAFNCGTPPADPHPSSWTVRTQEIPVGETGTASIRFAQHAGTEGLYDIEWSVSDASVVEIVGSRRGGRNVTLRGKALGTSTVSARLFRIDGTVASSPGGAGSLTVVAPPPPVGDDPERSIAAFLAVADAFVHPRCANCHVAGDTPKQGDNRALHDPDRRGDRPMRGGDCVACHSENPTYTGYDAPVPPMTAHIAAWSLPPPAMSFEDPSTLGELKLPGDICRQILQFGGDASGVVNHLETDNLVAWAFAPGGSRSPAFAAGQAAFLEKMREWRDAGGYCPD